MSKVTLVTGLWDISRSELSEGWGRSFEDHYVPKFKELLEVPHNLIVFGEESLRETVFSIRSKEDTLFIVRDKSWFNNEFFTKIQEIRNNPDWYNLAGWLKESTQASLEYYNPLVMSKMFLLNDARIMDTFNSEQLYWIDAGLTNTVHQGYFTSDNVIDKISKKVTTFNFVCFPYQAENEIHGFNFKELNKIAGKKVELVARGGFFGGPKDSIEQTVNIYYSLLNDTLGNNLMGTEESLFSIMVCKYPDLFSYSKIESNGLMSYFFEKVKNGNAAYENVKGKGPIDYKKVGLYVITYNSPKQFETLCRSFEEYDQNYLDLPKKILLNNSIDRTTDKKYKELCKKYGFEEIKKDNIGICGGRQFVAEHFDADDTLEYSLFFEDDMFFYNGKAENCRNGFIRKIPDLYKKSLEIAHKEDFDYFKMNFSEFYGDNTRQWSWYNVPQHIKDELFQDSKTEAPFLKYTNIKSHRGIPYATGDIYYCNWPQIVSKKGNKKMFLDVKWDYPYEQTWMSHIYQETVKGNISTGILLATPTEHDRFDFYPKEERREN
jgi:hypothetical protein